MATPDALARPDGRDYRPRRQGLHARGWENPDDCGVIVFGTLDPETALPLARGACASLYGSVALDPRPGWYRDTFRRGERVFDVDEKRGAPGVWFTCGEDPEP